ncbi:MAG: 5-formyltetrahydrofolate cyclo-ligase [Methylococcales bacterium]
MRRIAYSTRNAQPDKEFISARICAAFTALPEYHDAGTVLLYLSCRSEVRTRPTVGAALASGKRIAIPYCTVDNSSRHKLGLWWLESLDELVPGMWNILEPPKSRWGEPVKEIDPQALDLIMVPGVAFVANAGRLGNGRGYYDRLLGELRSDCLAIGVGFETQIFEEIPMDRFDRYLDGVITEANYYRGKGRGYDTAV